MAAGVEAGAADLYWAGGNISRARCALIIGDAFALSPPDAIAKALSHRDVAQRLSMNANEPPSVCVASLDEAVGAINHCVAWSPTQEWIAKARFTAAGRDRVRGAAPLSTESSRQLARLLATHKELQIEPWLSRVADAGVLGAVAADGTRVVLPPHGLLCDARGKFIGIDQEPAIDAASKSKLLETANHVGAALAARGHLGPFSVDAFTYRDHKGGVRLRAICEINPRMSFGLIAHALFMRTGHSHFRISSAALAQGTTWVAAPELKLWVATH